MVSQKATILCILEILQKYTDEEHRISTEKIREKLKMIYDIDMERRTIYRNIDALRSMGIDIQGYTDNREGYCLMDRTFEVSEIRLLCDAVASSDMITPDDSKKIVNRLADMLSVFQSRVLQRTVYVKERKSTSSHTLFYNIDTLNIAISQGCKIRMEKLHFNHEMKLVPTIDGSILFNPYATVWAAGHYYVIGKNEADEKLAHYRIDRLRNIEILERNVEIMYSGFNPNQYAEEYIYRKGEKKNSYTLVCDSSVWEELVETFTDDISVMERLLHGFRVKINAIPSRMKEWVLSRSNQCEVISPKQFREEVQIAIMESYKKYW